MQTKNITSLVLVFFLAMASHFSFAQESASKDVADEDNAIKEEINEVIDHHLLDSHYVDFFADEEEEKHYGFALPVILIDDGVQLFSASEFDHGNEVVEKSGNHYAYYNSKVYKTDSSGKITLDEKGFPTQERPFDLSITKNVFIIILMAVFMILLFSSLAKSYRKNQIPTGAARLLEPIIVFVRDDIAKASIGPKYKKYMSFLLTVFFFILFLNILGLFPFGVNVTGSITVTLALALVTFFITQFSGNRNYWKHIFWFPDIHPIMKIIMIPIELLGMLTKPFSLMIRLFANMTAGHVMIMSFISFIFIFKNWIAGPAFFGFTIFIYVLKVLVAFLQAYIFTLLSALYISAAVEEPEMSDTEEDEVPVV